MGNINKAIDYALNVAADNYHGYSQSRRGYQDKDCSKLVLDGLDAGGFHVGGATYTGNMLKVLLAAGFKNVASKVNLKTGDGLLYGDIVLRPSTAKRGGHTAFCLGKDPIDGKNKIIQAAGDLDSKPGDSSGKEIFITNYYNSPFTYVLRAASASPIVAVDTEPEKEFKIGDIVKVNGPGYQTSYGEGSVSIIKGTGKIINIYDKGRKCPYAVNYTDLTKNWTDRFFSEESLSF